MIILTILLLLNITISLVDMILDIKQYKKYKFKYKPDIQEILFLSVQVFVLGIIGFVYI